jgi:hypothetical protein
MNLNPWKPKNGDSKNPDRKLRRVILSYVVFKYELKVEIL